MVNQLGIKHVQPVGLAFFDTPNAIWYFPLEPNIVLQRDKNVIRTEILYNKYYDGTVKELFSNGDYEIQIDGIIWGIDPNNYDTYDEENVGKLKEFLDENKSLAIVSEITNTFNVGFVAISKINRLERVGNQFHFAFTCYSDKVFELI